MNNTTSVAGEKTRFASPERSPVEEIRTAAATWSGVIVAQLLDSLPDFVLILNQNRQAVFLNRPILDFLAMSSDQAIGRRPGELLCCTHCAEEGVSGCGTSEFCKTCGAVEAILSSLRGRSDVKECRILRNTPDGVDALDLRVWASPFKWEGSEYCLFTVADIRDEKRRLALERIFFHDIMNTAAAISSMSELLNNGQVGLDEMGTPLMAAATSLIEEIKAQRDLVAAEQNELTMHWGPVRVHELLEDVMGAFQRQSTMDDKVLILHPESRDVIFVSDRVLLHRVVYNMVKNAVEASSTGQQIQLRCAVTSSIVEITCHNDAVMPEEVRNQVFHRSFTTKGVGRGLGTYGMKLLTERYLGGRVGVASSPATGTSFVVSLPFCRP